MPFGGHDWLALTQEPALEPELPICDPHHHFWDLRTDAHPYQRYLLHELAGDIRAATTCAPPCSSRPARCTARRPRGDAPGRRGRVRPGAGCGQRQRHLRPRPGCGGNRRARQSAILGERVAPVLEALQAASPNRFRGIRHSVTWDPHPEVENTAAHRVQGQLGSDAIPGWRARCWPGWDSRWRAGATFRSSRSWQNLPRRSPTCRSS